jgi:hypothetical protein
LIQGKLQNEIEKDEKSVEIGLKKAVSALQKVLNDLIALN